MRALGIAFVCTLSLFSGQADALCPLCLAPSQTWSEIVAESEVVGLGRLLSMDKGNATRAPSAVFELTALHKADNHLKPGQKVRVDDFVAGNIGDLFLLTATEADTDAPVYYETFATETPRPDISGGASVIRKVSATFVTSSSAERLLQWSSPEPVSQAEYDYVVRSPSPETNAAERLRYFLPFMESSYSLIAGDAWGEFAKADYDTIRQQKHLFSAARLRGWIADPETSPERLSLYGLMLGMCGDASDGEFLKRQIGPGGADELRFGVEGLMAGLLTISGEEGLQFLESTRLTSDVQMLEAYAVVQAIQFAWKHEPDRVSRNRLQQAMRLTVNNESLREITIRDLARWQDWELLPQLSQVYEQSQQDDPGTVQAVAGYLLIFLRDNSEATDAERAAAESLLQQVRKDAPRVVRAVELELRRP